MVTPWGKNLYEQVFLKSDNLQYNTPGCWDERLIDQASDVPSIFFHNFLQNSLQKSFQFIFYSFIILQKLKERVLSALSL